MIFTENSFVTQRTGTWKIICPGGQHTVELALPSIKSTRCHRQKGHRAGTWGKRCGWPWVQLLGHGGEPLDPGGCPATPRFCSLLIRMLLQTNLWFCNDPYLGPKHPFCAKLMLFFKSECFQIFLRYKDHQVPNLRHSGTSTGHPFPDLHSLPPWTSDQAVHWVFSSPWWSDYTQSISAIICNYLVPRPLSPKTPYTVLNTL